MNNEGISIKSTHEKPVIPAVERVSVNPDISSGVENNEGHQIENVVEQLDAINFEKEKQEDIVSSTTEKVNKIRHDLDLHDDIDEKTDIPSVSLNKIKIKKLETSASVLIERMESILKIPENIKKTLRNIFMSVLLTYGSTGEALGQQTYVDVGSQEETISSVETPGKCEFDESLQIGVEEIKKHVFEDEKERFFLSEAGKELYSEPRDVINGGDNIKMSLETIVEFCEQKGIKDIKDAHTHNASQYSGVGYRDKDIKEIRSGEVKPSPMAPSTVDLQCVAQTFSYFEKKGITIDYEIFDVAGKWTYKVDRKNMSKFNQFKEMVEKFPEMAIKAVGSLSKEERAILEKHEEYALVHPRKLLETLKQNPETRAVGEKLEKSLIKEASKLVRKYPKINEAFENINKINLELCTLSVAYANPTESQFDELIDKYKKAANELGFEVDFTPYQK